MIIPIKTLVLIGILTNDIILNINYINQFFHLYIVINKKHA